MRGFVAYPSMSVVRKEDFDTTANIADAFARHITSPTFPPDRFPVRCAVSAQRLGSGVRLLFTSAVDNLDREATIAHRFYFIDRDETRQRLHVLGPTEPEATTEVLVLFDPGGSQREYCHATVFDGDNYVLASHTLVFNSAGGLVSYPFTRRYVSPLSLGRAEVVEARDTAGRRVLRFCVGLLGLDQPAQVTVAWQAIGMIRRETLVCTPERPEIHSDLVLDDNPLLAPGEWSLIAVDDQERLLAQTIVTVAGPLLPAATCA